MKAYKLAAACAALAGCTVIFAREAVDTAYALGKSYYVSRAGKLARPRFSVGEIRGSSGPRIYLIHGMKNDYHQWDKAPFKDIFQSGRQYVLIELPEPTPAYWKDGGAEYCAMFHDWLSKLDTKLDAKYGKAAEKAVAGISFGGLHAIMAAATVKQFDRYVALSPVTDVSALAEYRWQDNDQCSPFHVRMGKLGLITYSTDDRRVNANLIAGAVPLLHAKSSVVRGIGHTTSRSQMMEIRNFLP